MDITVTVNKDWWPSPAKLNLFLHILGRYDNGYHKLQSLFQMLDYGDKLAFDINHTGTIAMSTPLKGVKDEDNLIIRAAKLLAAQTKTKLGAHISLEKCLPMGGGIGGGSSNAATTLVALNALWGTRLSVHQLADIGLQLGASLIGNVATPTGGDIWLPHAITLTQESPLPINEAPSNKPVTTVLKIKIYQWTLP